MMMDFRRAVSRPAPRPLPVAAAPAVPLPRGGIATADLELLIGAVAGRLQRLAQQAPGAAGGPLLECAQALLQLQEGVRGALGPAWMFAARRS